MSTLELTTIEGIGNVPVAFPDGITLSSPLAVASGGTGLTAPGTSGNVLTSNGTAWVSQASSLTGTANGVAYFNGSGALTSGSALTFDGASLGVNSVTVGRGGGAVSTNTAVGDGALASNTTGNYNVAVGFQAGYSNAVGGGGVSIGYQALKNGTDTNTALGYQAGFANTSGYNNLYVGPSSGANKLTGSYCTYIGAFGVTGSSTSVNNELVIASGYNGGTVTGKGDSTGFINASGGGVYQGNNSSSWSTTSDQRLKKNIVDNNDGLAKITAIRVRNFEYRLPEEVDPELKSTDAIKKEGVQLGIIAQELQTVLPECVRQESTGVLSVDSDNLTWYLVNAIKELKAEFDSYKLSHP